jgi:hypothetical protein
MNGIKALSRAAIATHRRGETWPAFWERHADQIKAAEPYSRERYRRLYMRLLSLVTSGDSTGQYPIDVGMAQWEADDTQSPTPVSDTQTQARCLWPMSATMPSQNEALR